MLRVTEPRILDRPGSEGRVSLQVDLLCDDSRFAQKTTFWYEVPEAHAPELSLSGDPWLALMLPLAVNLQEPLRIQAPVDSALLSSVQELMAIWSLWYPKLPPVRIEAEAVSAARARAGSITASLFSSGVDAWFSLLRHADGAAFPKIDELLTVLGLDVQLDNPQGCQGLEQAQRVAADHYGLKAMLVSTNLAKTGWFKAADWGMLGHGCALAAVGLILERRYSSLIIPSSYRYSDLHPWGSHPLTDPLLSTSSLRMIHDGAAYSRVQKTEYVARSEVALNSLQVCWETGSFRNCGVCEKCCRTAATLKLLGALDRCRTLDTSSASPEMVVKFYPHEEGGCIFNREIRQLAVQQGNREIVRAVDLSLRRYRYYAMRQGIWKSLKKFRFLRRLGKVAWLKRIASK